MEVNVRKRPNRLPAAALGAVTAIGLSAGSGTAQTSPGTPHQSWQLRAQVRAGTGTPLSNPRTLPDAMDLIHQAACRSAEDLLQEGQPAGARLELTLWRQPGPTDATRTDSPDMRCHAGPGRTSAFHLVGHVAGATGWMGAAQAVHRVAVVANHQGDEVLATGGQERITLRLGPRQKPVPEMIRSLAIRYELSVSTSLRVAACESHFNPRAFSYPYAGVFQQDIRRWDRRARHFGHPGASPFDAYSNVDVSLKMARAWGWDHWGCA
jgi:hypothetical protein